LHVNGIQSRLGIQQVPPVTRRTKENRCQSARESQPASIYFKAPLLNYGTPLPLQPKIKKIMHITRNRKNSTLAIPADAAAMPPNPNTAATIAIIRKVIAQPNIISPPLVMNRVSWLPRVCSNPESLSSP